MDETTRSQMTENVWDTLLNAARVLNDCLIVRNERVEYHGTVAVLQKFRKAVSAANHVRAG